MAAKMKRLKIVKLLFAKKQFLIDYKGFSDGELITIINKKNKEAYIELFARYQKKLFGYIYHLIGNREETEDILQNVFSKTYKNIDHFDVTRKFSSWIYRIAHNEAVNFLKRKSNRYTISWEDIVTNKDILNSVSQEELPEDMIEHKEVAKEIAVALEKLPFKYREILLMRYFQEYSYKEIGKILKKSVNTVGTLINRSKKKLAEIVEKK
jgi:RNA polymerase sigma-70 factor (ECF subfamily)